MFSQAHLQKNTHKKIFSLVEISNIHCVFLLRNAMFHQVKQVIVGRLV